ncbi:MAG: type III-A CRISPR-associated protein Csm2 [Chloroflexota bacterium]|nr:type III-A CRISPR-associated protein Csm2 [Dehalococcoidia bacterium]MDW8254185.1 type III-A CRISPR-associated protein Csm2 [Chloroflexota bacterium]
MTEAPERRSGPPRGGPRPSAAPRGEGRRPAEPLRPIDPADLRAIIVDGNAGVIVQEAQRVARVLAGERLEARQATSGALRVLWGELRRIELDWPTDEGRALPLVKPRLAYLAGRAAGVGRGVTDLYQTLAPAVDLVGNDRDRFDHLVHFVEALMAYFYAGPQFSGR